MTEKANPPSAFTNNPGGLEQQNVEPHRCDVCGSRDRTKLLPCGDHFHFECFTCADLDNRCPNTISKNRAEMPEANPPSGAEQLLRECMASAVRLAITRHNLELDPDAATEGEIAYDAAGACFGEECCDDKPLPEVTALLSLVAGRTSHAPKESTPPFDLAYPDTWMRAHNIPEDAKVDKVALVMILSEFMHDMGAPQSAATEAKESSNE